MKRIFLSILAIVSISLSIFAEGHMTFKGIEIDGKRSDFIAALKQQKANEGHGSAFGHGNYYLQANVGGVKMNIFLQSTPVSGTVYSVIAGVDIKSKATLDEQYKEFKKMLIEKYGKGKKKKLADFYWNEFNFESGKVSKVIMFETEKGKIYLYTHKPKYSYYSGSLNLQYVDKANEQLKYTESSMNL